MFSYPSKEAKPIFRKLLHDVLPGDGWVWLEREVGKLESGITSTFGAAFVMMPRKTGKERISIPPDIAEALQLMRPGLKMAGWSVDRISRTFLLMCLPPEKEKDYVAAIEDLFLAAEMNELVALYGALPMLAYPQHWNRRCAEGIRSNIGQVLEAIMCDNPYPSEELDTPAWNQLILKAIFTEKPLLRIVGLRERANASLAHSISDFAHERWAAHRTVNPLVWICVERFIDDRILDDLQRLARSTDSTEQKAAALLCAETEYEPARSLIDTVPHLRKILADGVTWDGLSAEYESARV
jgi:hypothetical protein